ncbi:hypothetical protein PBR31_00039 [Xanthomonas phage PBR31]|jgi:hypothetical protein|uniref:Uncharacterized protein n=1 Tax=Xanthomonas phage PPDBI TaxID=2723911 RepID=A0A6H0X5X9_9CAUD|nr:hypothetical protein [Ralstonia pickettii]NYS10348.1 hypothetical protein [Ralstonia pickettii]QIN95350.1 hypothetical protein PBR31_00039 [Xanthomonas phage PBR31]QIW89398.1 hypothetical protein PPDBI_00039 [Xanthomonas phage PPDBI]
MIKQYFINIASAIDRLINAARGGSGDETLSSAAGKSMVKGRRWACILCRFLDLFQRDHCLQSINPDDGKGSIVDY